MRLQNRAAILQAMQDRLPDSMVASPVNEPVDGLLGEGTWLGWHQNIIDQVDQEDAPDIAFFGDSITEAWLSSGKGSWDAMIQPLGAVDYGVAGSTTQNLLWHLENGGLKKPPRVAVVQVGINNLGEGNSPRDTAQGVLAVLKTIRKESPSTRVLLLSIFPNCNPVDDPSNANVNETNALLSRFNTASGVRFLDLTRVFVGPEGQSYPEYYRDAVHLNAAGYEAVVRELVPPLQNVLAHTGPDRLNLWFRNRR